MKTEYDIKLHDGQYQVTFGTYMAGQTAIIIRDGHFPYAKATVCLPEEEHYLKPGEVFIKNYSENVGMLESLVAAGIVEDTGKTVNLGHCVVHIAKILVGIPA